MSMDFFLGGGGEWYFWISEQDDISKSRWQGIFKLFVNNKPMGVQKVDIKKDVNHLQTDNAKVKYL